MIHLVATISGMFILFYESIVKNNIHFAEYSYWFLASTTIIHLYSTVERINNVFSYSICSTGLFLVFPVGIYLTQVQSTTRELVFDAYGSHVLMPLLSLACVNWGTQLSYLKTTYFILLYTIIYVVFVEIRGSPFPYVILDKFDIPIRIIGYFFVFLSQCLGVLILKHAYSKIERAIRNSV